MKKIKFFMQYILNLTTFQVRKEIKRSLLVVNYSKTYYVELEMDGQRTDGVQMVELKTNFK